MLLPRLSVTRTFCLAAALIVAIFQSPNQHPEAQCGPNPIVCENMNTGSPASEWDINAAGDDTIQGFATSISVNKGETVRPVQARQREPRPRGHDGKSVLDVVEFGNRGQRQSRPDRRDARRRGQRDHVCPGPRDGEQRGYDAT
jgi:hypothetical protein